MSGKNEYLFFLLFILLFLIWITFCWPFHMKKGVLKQNIFIYIRMSFFGWVSQDRIKKTRFPLTSRKVFSNTEASVNLRYFLPDLYVLTASNSITTAPFIF